MDIKLDYELFDYIHFLCSETFTSAYPSTKSRKSLSDLSAVSVDIGTEQGDGQWIKSDYIEKGTNEALTKELCSVGIILNEEQKYFIEHDSSVKDYIRLYLSCCTYENKEKIHAFNMRREKLNCTFLADNTENTKNEITCYGHHIKNLYDITDVSVKKLGIKELTNVFISETDQHHDVYAPTMVSQPLGFCQANLYSDFENDAILLMDGTNNSPHYLRTSQLKTRGTELASTSYTMLLESHEEKTYAYQSPDQNAKNVIDNWQPKINYQGIKKSWILDLPVSKKSALASASDIAKYDEGLVYALRMIPTKSTLNSIYSTEMSAQTDIQNCRSYVEIKTVSGRPYLKYYDDVNYVAKTTITDTSVLQDIKMDSYNSQTGLKNDVTTKPYQKIEFLYPIDYKVSAKHKSNLFSIELSGTGIETEYQNIVESLEEQSTDSNAVEQLLQKKSKLDMLKFDINSAIKEIAKNVAPANTQLFDVVFLD